jgi:hypothetical protein
MVTQGSGGGGTVVVGSGGGGTVVVGSGAGGTVVVGSGAGGTVVVGSGSGGAVVVGSGAGGTVAVEVPDVDGVGDGDVSRGAAGPVAVAAVEPGLGLTDTEFVGSAATTAKIEVDAAAPAGARSEAGRALTPRRYVVAIEVTSATYDSEAL